MKLLSLQLQFLRYTSGPIGLHWIFANLLVIVRRPTSRSVRYQSRGTPPIIP